VNVSPLGAAALAGSSLPIDRHRVAKLLGFDAPAANSLDVSSDRDFLVEFTNTLALIAAHLSTWAEEWILWNTTEFGFLKLPDAFTTGSSIMPQKKNPDVLELVRGKSARVIAAAQNLLVLIKGLPLAYNKDLQETQEPLYDAVDTAGACLAVAAGMIASLEFDVARMRAAVDAGHLVATELADYLVGKGVAFRDAHDVAGALVRTAIDRGVELAALDLDTLRAAHPAFDADVAGWLDPARAVDRRDLPGGPARARVIAELDRLDAEL
jgi:argininosuccinate lyase